MELFKGGYELRKYGKHAVLKLWHVYFESIWIKLENKLQFGSYWIKLDNIGWNWINYWTFTFYFLFTSFSSKMGCTFARIASNSIGTSSTIQTGSTGAIINLSLAQNSRITWNKFFREIYWKSKICTVNVIDDAGFLKQPLFR